jgi:phosphopantothenoylcysteine synthetase/decarboxylase
MTRYTATIRHHSIARARIVNVGDDLNTAKRNATREFGDEFVDYTIIIRDSQEQDWGGNEDIVASKRVGAKRWN